MLHTFNEISAAPSLEETLPENIIINNNRIVVSHEQSDSDQDKPKENLLDRKRYGNMKVLYEGKTAITLGPDYWCFLPTFLVFCVVSYLVTSLVFTSTSNIYFRLITAVICIGQPLSYLLVALSNPGIVTKSVDHLNETDKKKCHKCAMIVPRKARHCRDCDVCIADYDHHCPWTSKCIGGGNLVRFYVFLGWTPIYLIFITVAFVACMSSNLIRIQQLPKKF